MRYGSKLNVGFRDTGCCDALSNLSLKWRDCASSRKKRVSRVIAFGDEWLPNSSTTTRVHEIFITVKMKYTERLFPDLSQSMASSRPTSEGTKKKLPFKAPSRVDSTKSASASSKATSKSAPKPTAKKSAPAKESAASESKSNGFKPASNAAAVVLSSDEDGDELDEPQPKRQQQKKKRKSVSDDEEDEADEQDERSEEEQPARKKAKTIHEDPAIPQKLLTRLLYEGFEDKNMKIGKEAMTVVGKYMETFVREALARAVYEREEAEAELGKDTGDGFLQVRKSMYFVFEWC